MLVPFCRLILLEYLPDYVINANTIGVYLRINWIIFGVIKRVIMVIKPT